MCAIKVDRLQKLCFYFIFVSLLSPSVPTVRVRSRYLAEYYLLLYSLLCRSALGMGEHSRNYKMLNMAIYKEFISTAGAYFQKNFVSKEKGKNTA